MPPRKALTALAGLAVPAVLLSLPTAYWPGALVASASQVLANSLTPLNTVAGASVYAAPILLALSLPAAYMLRKRLALGLVAGYAVAASLPLVTARLGLAAAGLGPGLPPLSPLILAPGEAVAALTAYAFHRSVVGYVVEARELARRPRRRRIRLGRT